MNKHQRPAYEDLPLIPLLIAETIAMRPYTGMELSARLRTPQAVGATEALRQQMTVEQAREFATLCDERCKDAYEIKADWFEKCVSPVSVKGRDRLYSWLSHWLAAYLANPESFREKEVSRQRAKALAEAVPTKILGRI